MSSSWKNAQGDIRVYAQIKALIRALGSKKKEESRRSRWRRRIKVLCGKRSWATTMFVSNTFCRNWIKRISSSCTTWIVKRGRWLRERGLLELNWKERLRLQRCRRYLRWSLRGRIDRCGRGGWGDRGGSARELLERINSSCSSGHEKRKSVNGVNARLMRPHHKVI